MKHTKFLDKLFAKLGYFPMADLPIRQIPITRICENVVTISSCKYEKAIRAIMSRGDATKAREILTEQIVAEVLDEAAKLVEIIECVNPIEIRATLRIVKPNK